MLKNKTALSLSPLALLTLAACGGSTNTASTSGRAENGPLTDAWAFLDLHTVANPADLTKMIGDGIYDAATETRVKTLADDLSTTGKDESGNFTIASSPAAYTVVVQTTASTLDSISGEAYGAGVFLKAPMGATMVSPSTTLVAGVMEASPTLTATEAADNVALALGFTQVQLDAGLDLTTYSAYEDTTGDADAAAIALAMQKSNTEVMSVVKSFAAAAKSAGADAASSFASAMGAINTVMAVKVANIKAGTGSAADKALDFGAGAADMASIVTNLKTNIKAATGKSDADLTAAGYDDMVTDASAAVAVAIIQIATIDSTMSAADKAKIISGSNSVAVQIEAASAILVGGGTIADAKAKITVTDETSFNVLADNPAPTAMALSGSTLVGAVTTGSVTTGGVETVTIAEDVATLVIGTVSGTDTDSAAADTSSALKFALAGGADMASFTINETTGVLSLKAQPDYETKSSYDVSVSATDAGGKSFIETYNVKVTDVAESGGFGIASDTVTWTDYNPATSATLNNQVMTSTTGATVTLGQGAMILNSTNMTNLTDGNSATTGVSPVLKFTLDTVPTGSGTATVKATITDGIDGTRSGVEDQISLTVNVSYVGNGTTASLTAAAATATGTYDKGDGTSVSFTVDNLDADSFSITAASAVTGMPAALNVKMASLYEAFVSGAGHNNMIQDGDYHLALETTLPLQNYANATVTNFSGQVELVASTTKAHIMGTAGADTITGTAASEIIVGGSGKDTITTGVGADYIVIGEGYGSTTLANTNTMTGHASGVVDGTGFTNSSDKFALDGLTFAELTIAADATSAADTNVSVTATGEYLMTITDLAYGFITANDFVLIADIA